MRIRILWVGVMLILAGPRLARADIPEHPVEQTKPFGQHTISPTVSFGVGVGSEVSIQIGAGFGYFVLDGFEPGITSDVSFGTGDIVTTITLLPYLRYFPYRSHRFSFFIRATGGRWFVLSNYRDMWMVGGSVGAVVMFNSFIGMQLEGGFSYLIPDADQFGYKYCPGDQCWLPMFSLGLVFAVNPVKMSRANKLSADD